MRLLYLYFLILMIGLFLVELLYLDVGLLNCTVDDFEDQNVGCQCQSRWSRYSCPTHVFAISLDVADHIVVETILFRSHLRPDDVDVFTLFRQIPNHDVVNDDVFGDDAAQVCAN